MSDCRSARRLPVRVRNSGIGRSATGAVVTCSGGSSATTLVGAASDFLQPGSSETKAKDSTRDFLSRSIGNQSVGGLGRERSSRAPGDANASGARLVHQEPGRKPPREKTDDS